MWTPLKISEFVLDKRFQWNASKFAIFYIGTYTKIQSCFFRFAGTFCRAHSLKLGGVFSYFCFLGLTDLGLTHIPIIYYVSIKSSEHSHRLHSVNKVWLRKKIGKSLYLTSYFQVGGRQGRIICINNARTWKKFDIRQWACLWC